MTCAGSTGRYGSDAMYSSMLSPCGAVSTPSSVVQPKRVARESQPRTRIVGETNSKRLASAPRVRHRVLGLGLVVPIGRADLATREATAVDSIREASVGLGWRSHRGVLERERKTQ